MAPPSLYYRRLPSLVGAAPTPAIPALDSELITNARLGLLHDCMRLWGTLKQATTLIYQGSKDTPCFGQLLVWGVRTEEALGRGGAPHKCMEKTVACSAPRLQVLYRNHSFKRIKEF